MGDIYLGLLVLAVFSTATFGVGRAIGRRVSPRAANWLSLLTVVTLADLERRSRTRSSGQSVLSNRSRLATWRAPPRGALGLRDRFGRNR